MRRSGGSRSWWWGGSEDEPLAEAMDRELEGPVLSLAGEATLRQTAAVIERARIYVGNDSGPLHIAASTGTPVVAIFASSNPANFGPPGALLSSGVAAGRVRPLPALPRLQLATVGPEAQVL